MVTADVILPLKNANGYHVTTPRRQLRRIENGHQDEYYVVYVVACCYGRRHIIMFVIGTLASGHRHYYCCHVTKLSMATTR